MGRDILGQRLGRINMICVKKRTDWIHQSTATMPAGYQDGCGLFRDMIEQRISSVSEPQACNHCNATSRTGT